MNPDQTAPLVLFNLFRRYMLIHNVHGFCTNDILPDTTHFLRMSRYPRMYWYNYLKILYINFSDKIA